MSIELGQAPSRYVQLMAEESQAAADLGIKQQECNRLQREREAVETTLRASVQITSPVRAFRVGDSVVVVRHFLNGVAFIDHVPLERQDYVD